MFSDILSVMGYQRAATTCTVHLVAYRNLNAATATLCQSLRQEAGRCWSDLVAAHFAGREAGTWLTDADLRAITKGGRYRRGYPREHDTPHVSFLLALHSAARIGLHAQRATDWRFSA